jgi:hypothetical protein
MEFTFRDLERRVKTLLVAMSMNASLEGMAKVFVELRAPFPIKYSSTFGNNSFGYLSEGLHLTDGPRIKY